VTPFVVADAFKPIAALLGSLLPLPAFELLRRKVLTGDRTPEEQAAAQAAAEVLEILRQDVHLCEQLYYIGVRSVIELATENPIRIFVETDASFETSLYVVDRGNLNLAVPDPAIRARLALLGVQTAVDLMTRVAGDLDTPNPEGGRRPRNGDF
jgi:hypothetical protein